MTEETDSRLLEYRRTGNDELRRELVLRYSPLVKKLAFRLRASLDKLSDMEDAVQEGMLALMYAIDSFDPSRGVPFESYAALRVRCGIMDYLREQYWAPRSVYQKARELESARQSLTQRLGREPLPEEEAAELGISGEAYRRDLQKISAITVVSLDTAFYETQGEEDFSLPAAPEDGPELLLQKKALRRQLAQAVGRLSEREQLVLSLCYVEELKTKEIARVLGVSVPRVSQIHHQALSRLRKELE